MGLRILQFGRSGQVGIELLARGIARGHDIAAVGRDIADLAQPERVPRAFSAAGSIDIVINGAAYTAVDKAESEPERANAVNGKAVGVLAETCAKRGVPLIHLSTDYVFDGMKAGPYVETDATAPLNAYGRSKLLGERLLAERLDRHIIMRTSWVFSAHGANFVKTMLRLGAERDALDIVDDQHGAPTSAGDIADACLAICERIVGQRAPRWGIYHFSSAGETTWRRFAEAIFADAPWARLKARINPISTAEYKTPARRPLNSRLDCAKLAVEFGIVGRPWRVALDEVLIELGRDKGALQ